MRNNHTQPGYILIVTLMVISLSVALVAYIFSTESSYVPFMHTVIEREKAKQLALGGLQIALSKLAQPIEIKKEEAKPASPLAPLAQAPNPEEQATKKWWARLVSSINRWQTFALKEEIDGIDGEIKIAFMCEEGKIDLNAWYDFKKHAFKGNAIAQVMIQQSLKQALKKIGGKEELFTAFEQALKKRKGPFDDISELLLIPGFEIFKDALFYVPPSSLKDAKEPPKKGVYLLDVFTVWSGTQIMNPWLFSDSISSLFDLKRAEPGDVEERKKIIEKLSKDFKSKTMWSAQTWKTFLEPLYGKDFTTLPKGIEFILSSTFGPKMFSVLSYGKVGRITQKVYAIIECTKEFKESTLSFKVTIKKLYWL